MRIGIDLGGSKIEALALDARGRELARQRVATPRGDYRATLAAIAGLIEQLETRLGQTGSIGVGIPGALSGASGRVKNANSTCLIGQPLDRDLAARLQRPVRLANDANCFALSEATDGAAAGAAVVFGVILGTGVGGGIVVDGRLLEGANRIGGEWGHNPMPWITPDEAARACYCGRRGCIETYLSGPGLCHHYRQRCHATAERVETIVDAAAAGDTDAEAMLARYCDWLARGLATVINLLDPDVIVLGGGLSNLECLYQQVPERWPRYVFSDQIHTRLCRARFGDSSGVRGAAWLWPQGPGPV